MGPVFLLELFGLFKGDRVAAMLIFLLGDCICRLGVGLGVLFGFFDGCSPPSISLASISMTLKSSATVRLKGKLTGGFLGKRGLESLAFRLIFFSWI